MCFILWKKIFRSSGITVLFLTKFDFLLPIDKIDSESDEIIICDDIRTRKTLPESENTSIYEVIHGYIPVYITIYLKKYMT